MNTNAFSIQNIQQHLTPNIGTILVVIALLFVNNVYASNLNASATPGTISYQGMLSSAGGTPVNTTVGLTFRLYSVQSGGTALWTETHSSVLVNNGLFHVQLGSITSIPSNVWDYSTVYLGVQVTGDSAELSPREVVSAVPYAMNSQIPDGSVTNAKIANGAVTSDKIAMTYWNINIPAATDNDFWTTTLSGQSVKVPSLQFSYTPLKNGVVFLNLTMTFKQTVDANLYCNIEVNNAPIARGTTRVVANNMDNCATNIAYPVSSGQTYQFYISIYSIQAGTTSVRPNAYTNLSAFYVAAP